MTAICAALGHPERELPLDHRRGHQRQGIGHGDDLRGALTRPATARRDIRLPTSSGSRSDSSSVNAKWRPADLEERRLTSRRAVEQPHWRRRARGAAHLLRVCDGDRPSSSSAAPSVEMAVVEVGLGGRLDATNVITPMAAVITSIDFDHQDLLGETLESIAREKAGVIKPGIPVIVGPVAPGARAVIEATCREAGRAAGPRRGTRQRHGIDGRHRLAAKPRSRSKPATIGSTMSGSPCGAATRSTTRPWRSA